MSLTDEPPLPAPDGALFLDFDGTLAEIAAHPQAVRVPPELPPLLAALGRALDGALAIITGRPVAEIDHFLHPLQLPAAGVHGVERRSADGRWQRLAPALAPQVLAPLRTLRDQCTGLVLEEKPGAVALHYRLAPALQPQCEAAMAEALRRMPGMALLHGKCVIELKPRTAGKDGAVRAFLDEAPFRGRRPWFFGDDVTDEAAFEAVQAAGGVAVKIGDGATCAPHRLGGPAALRQWMQRALQALASAPGSG